MEVPRGRVGSGLGADPRGGNGPAATGDPGGESDSDREGPGDGGPGDVPVDVPGDVPRAWLEAMVRQVLTPFRVWCSAVAVLIPCDS